jgi:hypothetical protein
MSSNRLIYDKCAYATEIKESTGPLEYNLFKGKYENCKQCEAGQFANILEFGPRADVESELYGLNRPGTLCPQLKFDPKNYSYFLNLTAIKCELVELNFSEEIIWNYKICNIASKFHIIIIFKIKYHQIELKKLSVEH